MLDIAPSELLLVGLVALIVIGPKDLPKAMRVVGYWVGRARGVARQFRSGFDAMVREAELAELQKQWASENERIMREHPSPAPALDAPAPALEAPAAVEAPPALATEDGPPTLVEPPVVHPAEPELPLAAEPEPRDKAQS